MEVYQGQIVIYYKDVDARNTGAPAIITRVHPKGILGLSVFPMGSGQMRYEPSVYHIDSPALRTPSGELTELAMRNGAWDYTKGDKPRLNDETATKKIDIWSKEFGFDQVCRKARGLGMTKEDVAKYYEDNGLRGRDAIQG